MNKNIINNRYEILERIGAGGMGVVYKALDRNENKIIALKVLSSENRDKDVVMNFKREFTSLTKLKHPNLVEVYDFGSVKYDFFHSLTSSDGSNVANPVSDSRYCASDDNLYYFTMEYINGVDLLSNTKGKDYDYICGVLVQICRVLEYIHSRGLIHYDIKPKNIMVMNTDLKSVGTVKLMDFGLSQEKTISFDAVVKGTLSYLAPEIAKRREVDHRADLYSLGVVLYQITTGVLPFISDNPTILLQQHVKNKPLPPSEINDQIPSWFERIILKLLEKEPSDRYKSANEIIKEINKYSSVNYDVETKETEKSYILSGRLVGREKDLDLLNHQIQLLIEKKDDSSLSNKIKPLIFISGEAGIGKSRLLREFKFNVQLSSIPFFTIRCYKDSQDIPYRPFVEAINQLIGTFPDTLELAQDYLWGLVRLLPSLLLHNKVEFGTEFQPNQEKLKLMDDVVNFLFAVSKRHLFVIAIDDLHWADASTMELIQHISRNINGKGLNEIAETDKNIQIENRNNFLICCTYRDEDISEQYLNIMNEIKSDSSCLFMSLERLGTMCVADFIASMLGLKYQPMEFSEVIHKETKGNPFFIEELMKSFVDDGTLYEKDGSLEISVDDYSELKLPNSVKDVIVNRLSKLSLSANSVLTIASVIGKEFSWDMLKAVIGEGFDGIKSDEDLWECLHEMKRKKLLIEELTEKGHLYNFSHSKMQDILYERIPDDRKKVLHNRIGTELEKRYKLNKEVSVEELAYHFIKADVRDKALDYLLRSAIMCSEVYANEKAISYYELALELSKEKGNLSCVSIIKENLGDLYRLINDYDTAIIYYKELLSPQLFQRPLSSQDTDTQSSSSVSHPDKEKFRDDSNLVPIFNGKSVDYNLHNQLLISRINRKLGETYEAKGEYEEALKYLGLALNILGDEISELEKARIYNYISRVYLLKGEHSRSIDSCLYALQLVEKSSSIDYQKELAWIYNNLGNIYWSKSDYLIAMEYYEKSLKIREKIGDSIGIATSYNNLGVICEARGEYSLALEYYFKSLSIQQKIGNTMGMAMAYNNLGVVYESKGEYSQALDYYQKSLKIRQNIGDFSGMALAYNNIGKLHKLGADYTSAIESIQESLKIQQKIKDKISILNSYEILGDIYLTIGDDTKALQCATKALEIANTMNVKLEVGNAYNLMGRIYQRKREFVKAKELIEKSLSLFSELGKKDRKCYAMGYLADIYREEKDFVSASYYINQSLSIARKLDAKPLFAELLIIKSIIDYESEFFSSNKSKKDFRIFMELEKQIIDQLSVAENTFKEINAPEYLVRTYLAIATVYAKQKKTSLAVKYYKKALITVRDISSKMRADLRGTYLQDTHKFQVIDDILQMAGNIGKEQYSLPIDDSTDYNYGKDRWSSFYNIIHLLNISAFDYPGVLDTIIDAIIELTSTERGFLLLFNESGELEVKSARHMDKMEINNEGFKVSKSIIEYTAKFGKAVYISDIADDYRFKEAQSIAELKLRSIICIPLQPLHYLTIEEKKNNKDTNNDTEIAKPTRSKYLNLATSSVIGVIYLDSQQTSKEFSDIDKEFLISLANQAAIFIENARLHQETVKKSERINKLYEVSKALVSILDLDKLLDTIMDIAIDITKAEHGFLVLIEKDDSSSAVADSKSAITTPKFSFKVAHTIGRKSIEYPEFQVSETIIQEVINKKSPVWLHDALADEKFKYYESVKELGLKSILCVPIMKASQNKDGEIIGVIYLDNRSVGGLFSSDELDLLTGFSAYAAISIENAKLVSEIKKSEEEKRIHLEEEYKKLKSSFQTRNLLEGKSEIMQSVFQTVRKVARTDATVLIYGESGTGKESICRLIHELGSRRDKPLVVVDCGAIPETLLESELFGYERGAFTGAYSQKKGKFELADGGTIFLDEIGDLPLSLQGKLLRALQEREISRIGGNKGIKIDVRIIAATNRRLDVMVEQKTFRSDLYYRLNVVTIELPSLRERKDDIMLFANFFLTNFKDQFHKNVKGFTDDAREVMLKYHWPGNIRELEHKVEQAVIMTESEYISSKDLDLPIDKQTKISAEEKIEEKKFLIPDTSKQDAKVDNMKKNPTNEQLEDKESLLEKNLKSALKRTIEYYIDNSDEANLNLHHNLKKDLIEVVEEKTLSFVLAKTSGNKSQAGKLLGIDFKTICRKLKKYQITVDSKRLEVDSNLLAIDKSNIDDIMKCIIEIIEARAENIEATYTDIFEFMKNYIVEFVIYKTSNNLTKASQLLGITRNTLRKVKKG